MKAPSQLVLEFDHRPALGGEDFLVAPCNDAAIAWIDRWPDWPSPVVVVAGPPGCGKSHLAQVFLGLSGGAVLDRAALMAPPLEVAGRDASAWVIDDMDNFVGDGNGKLEEALFHLYNSARESGRRLLVTAKTPPSRWPIKLADLASRLKASAVVEIGAPDDALIAAVLVKQFADRQLAVDDEVLAYVQPRMERSFDAVRQLVEAADRMALAEKKNITVPLLRRVLETLEKD
ncbi:MAG: DNA replication protein [Rhodospirillaceae bacterium]|nr:DNA replication protein [Rhodospirillaceae bacterium]